MTADPGAGASRPSVRQPYRWEVRPGHPESGPVAAAGEAATAADARLALARALVPHDHAVGVVVRYEAADRSAREVDRLTWAHARVPLDVALAVVTGRRVDRPEHEALTVALMGHLAAAAGRTLPEAQRGGGAPELLHATRAFAARAFPMLDGEHGDEIDRHPFAADPAAHGRAAGAWLAAREARYGATVPFRPDAAPSARP